MPRILYLAAHSFTHRSVAYTKFVHSVMQAAREGKGECHAMTGEVMILLPDTSAKRTTVS